MSRILIKVRAVYLYPPELLFSMTVLSCWGELKFRSTVSVLEREVVLEVKMPNCYEPNECGYESDHTEQLSGSVCDLTSITQVSILCPLPSCTIA